MACRSFSACCGSAGRGNGSAPPRAAGALSVMTRDASPADAAASPGARWLAWLVGGGVLAALVLVVLRGTEERALLSLLAAAEPRWLGWAALLQAGTYLAQATVWLTAIHAAGHPVSVGTAYRLSGAELF